MSPHININAMMICNPEETLCLADHRTYTLLRGVDQMDARYKWLVGAGYPVNRVGALGLEQPPLKTSIVDRSFIARGQG